MKGWARQVHRQSAGRWHGHQQHRTESASMNPKGGGSSSSKFRPYAVTLPVEVVNNFCQTGDWGTKHLSFMTGWVPLRGGAGGGGMSDAGNLEHSRTAENVRVVDERAMRGCVW